METQHDKYSKMLDCSEVEFSEGQIKKRTTIEQQNRAYFRTQKKIIKEIFNDN